MSTKRVHKGRSKRPLPYCLPTWSPEQRIAHYSKPEPLTGCHIWKGHLAVTGYGRVYYNRRLWLAHRLAWTLKNGPIPDGMVICHRCNVRRCVNPDHLALGTRADNNADTKAARLRLADAREATAGPAFDPGAMAIRIFVGGVEMRGRVLIEAISRPAEDDHVESLRSTNSRRS